MSWELAAEVAEGFAHTLWRILPYLLGMGIVFSVLSRLSPCNEGKPWWHKRGLVTDICYWLIVPLFTRYARIGFAVMVTVYLLGIKTTDGIVKFYEYGHGPLATLPLWLQIVVYLIGTEFCLYWIHRAFHQQPLWKYHAVHHSSQDVEWISAARFHPLNLLLGTVIVDVGALLAGISPDIFLFMAPFNTITSAFVHANLDWTLGPLKYVIAGPVFHRWHHTQEAGDKNFAGTFSLFDYMFGTFYMPEGQLPKVYGIDDKNMPESFAMQVLYPVLR